MKKRKIYTSIACALLCASTLTACSNIDYTVPLTAYWYDHYATTPSVVEETLVYKVTFEASSSLAGQDWAVSYNEGTYTTHLTKENDTYVYRTELSISGTFSYGLENTHAFTDSVKTAVTFNDKSKAPIYSWKEIHSTSPVNAPTAESYFTETHQTVETFYEADLSKGTCVTTDLTKAEPKPVTNTFEIDSKYTYVDNEQLLFALRGLNQKTSPSFYVYAPFSRKVQTVNATFDALKTGDTFSFETVDDNKGKDTLRAIPFYPITLGIDEKNSGAAQTIWLAQLTDPSHNEYRNVILWMRVTLAYNVGTLNYSLQSANFIDK